MRIIKSINKLNKEVNFKANIGFVPTMGALHKGHLSLIDSCKKKCDKTLASIFVNPSQFNKKNDYKKYPRNLSRDIKILKKKGVDYVFIPNVRHIYKNKKKMRIKIINKDKVLCAKFRRGHFEGVLAVMNQLLKIVKAKYVFLGQKDYQQVYLIKKFIKNKFNTKIIPCKTIRDVNSLPYSSRNFLLKKNELGKASIVSSKIRNLYNLIKKKFIMKNKFNTKIIPCKTIRDANSLPYSSRNFLLKKNDLVRASIVSLKIKKLYNEIKKRFIMKNKLKFVKKDLVRHGINIEYFEIRNNDNLSKKFNKKNFKIFVAFYINNVRLIDNF